MELTQREFVTALHGMLFGGFFLMALFGAFVLLLAAGDARRSERTLDPTPAPRWHALYLIAMCVVGWAAVLSGAYVIYPWYRAVAPVGADLTLYPKFLLTSHSSSAGWHNLGMEWKEHVAWIAPMGATLVAFVVLRHRAVWNAYRQVRVAVLGFAAVAFLAAALAGGWGAMIDKAAPVRGGSTIKLMRSAK